LLSFYGEQLVMFNPSSPPPFFAGMELFGSHDEFVEVQLEQNTLPYMEAFIGHSIPYGPSPGTQIFCLTGQWTGFTEDEVLEKQAKLLSFVGQPETYLRPTGDIFPSTIQPIHNCYFTSDDFAADPNGVQNLGPNFFGLRFSLILREIPVT
jgi:hypothetical protein